MVSCRSTRHRKQEQLCIYDGQDDARGMQRMDCTVSDLSSFFQFGVGPGAAGRHFQVTAQVESYVAAFNRRDAADCASIGRRMLNICCPNPGNEFRGEQRFTKSCKSCSTRTSFKMNRREQR